ncbi:dTDP-4-amino-4,6-dideoxygalactose transaminase [Hyphococcus lacteus]|uniref:dTDP-4-amino-4,6-dideoxygalactose transaminase n=1 Tax=Hyphococcus lacteus TaxID=3143536 RepID=A0ABV3Z6M0_9PROT
MGTTNIPYNRPALVGKELEYITDAIKRLQLSGDGHYTEQCQNWINKRIGCAGSLLTHSCTAALEMAAILTGIGPGDEVIMPSFTFVSTANAVVLRGGKPVFVDVRPDTLNMDENLIVDAITERTKAIFTVHYAGVCSELDKIRAIADDYGLWLVEDAAQALGSTYKGRQAGSIGHLSTISFHETKNITCGEGGALIINDSRLMERAEIIREKGTNRTRFFRGQVDKYTWVDIGSSYLPGELSAAFLFGQLENVDKISAERLRLWNQYNDFLRGLGRNDFTYPHIPDHCEHNGHLYYVLMPNQEDRANFIGAMKENGIMTPFHYVPLHSAPAGMNYGRAHGPLKVTNDIAERLVRLPIFYKLGQEIDDVIKVIEKVL